jgi:hypothetical protein
MGTKQSKKESGICPALFESLRADVGAGKTNWQGSFQKLIDIHTKKGIIIL